MSGVLALRDRISPAALCGAEDAGDCPLSDDRLGVNVQGAAVGGVQADMYADTGQLAERVVPFTVGGHGDGDVHAAPLPMRQPMTLTFSAWAPFWPCVMSNSTFCPSSRLR
jgi:hypothetical protein